MINSDLIRNRINLQTLVVVAALIFAPAFGIAIAAAMRGQILWLIAVGGVGGIVVTVLAPVEVMLMLAVLSAMLADSRLIDSGILYYVRFVPMGMLMVRTILDVAFHRIVRVTSSPTLLWSGLALCGFAVLSSLYAADRSLTLQRTLSMVLVVVAFGLGLPNYLATFGQMTRALKLVLILIVIFVLAGAVLGSEGDSASGFVENSFVRIRGFFGNVNTQGLMAMLVFYPLTLWWRTEKNNVQRFVLAALVSGWVVIVLLSGSRASFVGLIAGGVTLAVLYGRSALRYAPYAFAVIVFVAVLLVTQPQFGHLLEFTNPDNGPVAPGQVRNVDRPYLIQRAIELGMRSPIVGIGFGGSDQVFDDDRPYLISQGVYVQGAHNSYTRMFVELGIVGVVLGLAVFGIVLAPVFLSPGRIRRDITLAFLSATVVAGMTNAIFEDWLYGFGNASTFPMWFLLALIPIRLAQLRTASGQEE